MTSPDRSGGIDRRSFLGQLAGAAIGLPGAYVLQQPMVLAAPSEVGLAVPEAPQLILATDIQSVSPRRVRIELDRAMVKASVAPRDSWVGLDRYQGPAEARFKVEGISRMVVSEEVHPLLKRSVVTDIDIHGASDPARLSFEGRARVARVFLELEVEDVVPTYGFPV